MAAFSRLPNQSSWKTPHAYTTAIALNNQGSQHLQNGRFLKAAKSFHSALDTINTAMEVDHEDDNDDSVENNTVTFEWSSEPRYPQHKDSEETFVYRRALIILPTLLMPMKPSDEGYVEESAAILYNLALAYHLYGLEEHKSQFLHTALKLYELTFGLAKTRMHHLFDLAVLNNLGQIHHEILDFDKSLQCFVHLSEELQCVSRPMDACNYMGFLLNLLKKNCS